MATRHLTKVAKSESEPLGRTMTAGRVGVGGRLALVAVRVYQRTLSPDHGWASRLRSESFCAHNPTCSQYAHEAIERHGVNLGVRLTLVRLRRCGSSIPVEELCPPRPGRG